jgi:thioesterase domain-containing protein
LAERLIADGAEVAFIGIVDADAESGSAPEFVASVERFEAFERAHGPERADAMFLLEMLKDSIPAGLLSTLQGLAEQAELARLLELLHRLQPNDGFGDAALMRRMIRVMRSVNSALCHYQLKPIASSVSVFYATKSATDVTRSW